MTSPAPELVALYVPGDRPDRFDKAVATCAGVGHVVIDLEDAVAADRKRTARDAAREFVSDPHPVPIVVRINGIETPWHEGDLEALAGAAHLAAVRLPKAESAADIANFRGLLPGTTIEAMIESAVGVENLAEIASAPGVVAVALGEADLRSDLGVSDPIGLDWIRSRLVIAARAAGLPAPMMSVFTDLADSDGLTRSCVAGRTRGFLGRSAIHPRQVPVIVDAFRPTHSEAERAREVLAALDTAGREGRGVAVLGNGRMVDAAMRRGAERTAALADAYEVREEG